MQRVDKLRVLWLVLGISAVVLICIFSSLTVIMGLRYSYVAMGIFAGAVLLSLYAAPICFIAYRNHRIYTKIVYAIKETPKALSEIAECAEIKEEYISIYTERCIKKKYIKEDDIKVKGNAECKDLREPSLSL